MKTTIEWLRTLPQEIRDEAISNMRKNYPYNENKHVESLFKTLMDSILWSDEKWTGVYERALKAKNEAEMEPAKKHEPPNTFDNNLRDWFAGLAMQGIASGDVNQNLTSEAIAAYAYEQADAMLAARKESE